MSRDFDATQPTTLQRARRRVALKTGFYTHALIFVLVNGGLFLLSLLGSWGFGWGDGWGHRHGGGVFFPLWGWGLGLTIHGVVVFLKLHTEGLRRRLLDREIEALKRSERLDNQRHDGSPGR